MKIIKDNFLTSIFKYDFYNIEIIPYNNDFYLLNGLLIKDSIYSIKLDSNNDIPETQLHNFLINSNWKLVGILTTYNLDMKSLNKYNQVSHVRLATINDIKRLKDIAFTNFNDDRFHKDNLISNIKANEYYSKWIENSVNGLTDYVFVYEENSIIVGFLSLNLPKKSLNYAQIVLNAIDKPFTRKGKYTELLKYTINFCIENKVNNLRIGTYSSSIGVHIATQKLGFNKIFYSYYYHLHT
jgi:hypothetical protein